MKRRILIAFLAMTLCLNSATIYAAGSTTPIPKAGEGSIDAAQASGQGDGTCDLTQLKESLHKTESSYCGKKCPAGYGCANSIGASGKYQFMPTTAPSLNAYKSAPPHCKTMGKCNTGFATEACGGVQEAVMDEFTLNNLKWLKKNCPAAVNAVKNGRTVTGYKTSRAEPGKIGCKGLKRCSCKVTWSGILAGAHIGGAGGVCSSLGTGGDVDDGATSRLFYVCEHKDLPVPGEDCNPKQYPNEGAPPSQAEPNPEGWKGFTPAARTGIPFNGLSDILKYYWVAAFQLMTEELTSAMMQQVEIIGAFFDAKQQLETQRLMQQKVAQAHKDYQPSKQMCEIGTFVRNLADTDERVKLNETALSRSMLDRALASGDVKTMKNSSDEDTRITAYVEKFCDSTDNALENKELCKDSVKPEQRNADINFTTTIDAPLTLEIDLLDGEPKPDEENIFAFLDYIFMHDRFPWVPASKTELFSFVGPYQEMRSLIAMRSVAYNSFANIISQKTQGPNKEDVTVAPFLKALMREMGVEDDDIEKTIGKNPSYYAQMEILTKKIYQHPEFISNLYDKPANVKRLRAAMTAIKLMQDRDIHDAMQRREMLMSMLLELQLRQKQQNLINGPVNQILSNPTDGTYGDGAANDFGVGTFNDKTGAGGF